MHTQKRSPKNGKCCLFFVHFRLKDIQRVFWNQYKNNPQLISADAVVCGFDSWHCLLFAPFNKKIIINSAYRSSDFFTFSEFFCRMKQSVVDQVFRVLDLTGTW